MFPSWDAGQRLSKKIILTLYKQAAASQSETFEKVPQNLIDAFKAILEDTSIDGSFAALALALPTQSELMEEIHEVDPVLLNKVQKHVGFEIATALESTFRDVLQKNDSKPGPSKLPITSNCFLGEVVDLSAEQMSKRAIKNVCLNYLTKTKKKEYVEECLKRFRNATNMTDSSAALAAMNDIDCEERTIALDEFYQKWKDDFLVVTKWLLIQVLSSRNAFWKGCF